ncbi:SGNH hydrolase domain-containing protein [Fastidiosibacter lacustris]|uniref:SGNH hydrolase domain-containing protein n=1 Tax=Fastidiosibacter lacustris TaxID=2056695 RepID=UPI000E34CF61|nr:SGNH hydrolase domain-containing protein [Fastidiosibacter lacustris]
MPVIVLDNATTLSLKKTCGLTKIPTAKCVNDYDKANLMNVRQKILGLKKLYPTLIFIDPNKIICENKKCVTSINKVPLYYTDGENSHLSYAGSTLIGKLYLNKVGNPFDLKIS